MLGPPEQFQIPPELQELILNKRCVAFVGSGLSAGIYPDWVDLVNGLCETCGSKLRVNADSPTDDFLDAAQDAKDRSDTGYFTFLGETFGRPATHTSLLYNAILALPFQSYLTVNLDPLLLLQTRTRSNPAGAEFHVYPSLDRKTMINQTIYYLHGFIEEGTIPTNGTIVLSRDEFFRAYRSNGTLMSFLVQTLENDPIVFIGCRLREPVMTEVFGICKEHQLERQRLSKQAKRPSEPPPPFILLPEPEVTVSDGNIDFSQSPHKKKEEDSYYSGMDIRVVRYPSAGRDHSALLRTLERLAGFEPPKARYGWEGYGYGQ